MEVKDVVFYAIQRLGFNGIRYTVYNARTGSTYIKVGLDRIRISDHPGTIDNYNYIIRCDCKSPMPIKGKVVAPANQTDFVIDQIIKKHRDGGDAEDMLIGIVHGGMYTKKMLKKLDVSYLEKIVGYDKYKEKPPSKEECIKRIIENPVLFYDFTKTEINEDEVING